MASSFADNTRFWYQREMVDSICWLSGVCVTSSAGISLSGPWSGYLSIIVKPAAPKAECEGPSS